jgi:Protein of unknown function (DUF2505)
MDFEIEQRIDGAPDAVVALLLDEQFLTARAQLPKLGGTEVLELTRDATRARLRVRMRFTAELSPAVTAVVDPAKLTWVDDAEFDLGARDARHEIQPDHYPDRLAATYRDALHPDNGATRRVLTGTLKVRALLVGGRVESAIVAGLREYAAAEAELLQEWLTL